MKKYEVGYIMKPNLDHDALKKTNDTIYSIFEKNASHILHAKEVGLKDLAYPIEGFKKGYYVWLVVNATPEAVKEFNRVVIITENIIRFIIAQEERKS